MLESYGRVLVTGGAGFIGSHLVDALVALGKEVVVFDRLSTGSEEIVSPQARLVTGDLRNPEDVAEAMTGVDMVFHVGANANGTVSINDPRLDFETNGLGTFNVLEAAVQADVRRLVYQSSAAVYGTPQTHPMAEDHPKQPFMPYGASKFTGEVLCGTFLRTYDLAGRHCQALRRLRPQGEPEACAGGDHPLPWLASQWDADPDRWRPGPKDQGLRLCQRRDRRVAHHRRESARRGSV